MNKGQNNYAFIDSQNLNLGVKSQGWRLDFSRFRIYLRDKYGVNVAYIFIGYVKGNEGLYANLERSGYRCIFKPTYALKDTDGDRVKGNVDAELVLHAMIEYNNYEKAVIVSGDGDFHCLIEYLLGNEKLLRVVIPNRNSYSFLLSKFHANLTFMNGMKQKLDKQKRHSLGTKPVG